MRKLYSTFRTMSLILGGLVLSEQALAQQNVQGHEYVDLGLPSGLLWATCNVGATAPEQYGDYLAWGEISNKSHYSWQSYQLGSGMDCDINKYMSTGTDYVLPIEDDVASQRWGEDWYVPSWEQYCELQIRCTWRRRYLNGVFGVEGTGPNGNTIFFPFAGAMNYGNLEHEASYGTYWTSYINPTQNYRAGVFFVASTNDYAEMWDNSGLRYIGNSVRAVCNATENEGKCGDNLTYSISDDYTMHIDGNGEMYDYYNYRNYNWARIKRVIVSEGVTSIGSRSFRNCTNLETVEFPSSLQAIYSCAFEGCSKLVDIKIPNSVTIIGADAFNGCIYEA